MQPHRLYDSLGRDTVFRQAAYRALFRYELKPGLVDEIRRATHGNFALGSARFAAEVGVMIGRRAMPGHSGQPRKLVKAESDALFKPQSWSAPGFTSVFSRMRTQGGVIAEAACI